jgi:hypothetical protein
MFNLILAISCNLSLTTMFNDVKSKNLTKVIIFDGVVHW